MDKALKIMNGMQARKIELANVNDLNKAVAELKEVAVSLSSLTHKFQRADMDLREAEQKMQQDIADYAKRLQDQFDSSVKEHARMKGDLRSALGYVKQILVKTEKVTRDVEQAAKDLGVPIPVPVKEAKQYVNNVNSFVNDVTTYIN